MFNVQMRTEMTNYSKTELVMIVKYLIVNF